MTTKEDKAWKEINRKFDDRAAFKDMSPQAKNKAVLSGKELAEEIKEECDVDPRNDKRQCLRGGAAATRVASNQDNYPMWVRTRMTAASSILQSEQKKLL